MPKATTESGSCSKVISALPMSVVCRQSQSSNRAPSSKPTTNETIPFKRDLLRRRVNRDRSLRLAVTCSRRQGMPRSPATLVLSPPSTARATSFSLEACHLRERLLLLPLPNSRRRVASCLPQRIVRLWAQLQFGHATSRFRSSQRPVYRTHLLMPHSRHC